MLWDSIQREYLMHVPTQYNADEPLPVLCFLHGMGGDISRYDSWYDLQAVSDRKARLARTSNFIVYLFIIHKPHGLRKSIFKFLRVDEKFTLSPRRPPLRAALS